MNKLPSVAIIIVNWNGRDYTHECLQSLRQLAYPNFKIILVDNGSTDGSVSFFRERHQEVEIIAHERNLGFTGGNNAGIRKALKDGYDYVLLLNNDTLITEEDVLSKMITSCEADSKIGMACPTIYYDKPSEKIWYAGATLSLWSGWKHHYTKPETDNVQSVGYTTGCCLLAKAKMIKDIGVLNEAYFLSVEDVEWSARAHKNGWETVYIPGVSIVHKDSISSRSKGEGVFSPTRIFYECRNSLWFIREYANPFQKTVIWPVRFFLYYLYKAFAYILLGRWEKLKAITRGIKEGMLTKNIHFKNS